MESRSAAETEERRARDRLAVLARAGERLASSLDPNEILGAIEDVVVPAMADACEITFGAGEDAPPSGVFHRGSELCVPLVVEGARMGAVRLSTRGSTRVLDDADVALVEEIARRAGTALAHAHRFEREQSRRERIARLHALTAALSRALSPDDVMRVAMDEGIAALRAMAALIYVVEGDRVRTAAVRNVRPAFDKGDLPLDGPEPIAVCVREQRAVFVESTAQHHAEFPENAAWMESRTIRASAFMCLPLTTAGRALGGLVYGFAGDRVFEPEERDLMELLASHCAQAFDRARQFERAKAATAVAEAANRMKDEFLATLSHELRTPLNAITGWVAMLRAGTLPPERRSHALEVIARNARAQEQLIADLLDVSRVISGRLQLETARVEAGSVVGMAVEAVRPTASDKGVELEVSLADGDAEVVGDAGRLQQVVWNLVTNAVKFTPSGGRVRVSLSREPGHVVVRVADDGRGIPADFLPHVFEPFRQADATFARKAGGLGLGLALARKLVVLHGGDIEARSEGEGRGAEFVVRLPGAGASDELPQPVSTPVPEPASTPPPEGSLAGLDVLVVEDEADARELVMAVLAQHGARVTGAASTAEALERFRWCRPALLVSDVGLPGEDGLSLVRRIRATPEGARVPAVALTAFARAVDRELAFAAGFDLHVPKPIEPNVLVRSVMNLLASRRSAFESRPDTH